MSDKTMNIDVHHVTRVEGHGNIVVDIADGAVNKVEWQVPEAPRFFEGMVVGRDHTEVASITSRICGICSIGHTLASLKATEAALGIRITEQTYKLRELLLHAETLQSHILHVCYLVVPDLLKVPSALHLAATHKDVVLLVTKLHRLANEMSDMIGGRTTHPIRARINGFSMLPTKKELTVLRARLVESVDDLKALAGVVKSLAGGLPDFVRETEYVSLAHPTDYAFYDGDIKSSDQDALVKVADYRTVTNEYVSPQSTAKWCKFNRGSYMASALARYNNNYTQLTELSLAVGKDLGLDGVNHNPYMNNVAQVVESVFAVEKSLETIDWLMDNMKQEDNRYEVKAGRGAGADEVPRGVLFHEYEYDKNGVCVDANCIIPTNENHANIQLDMEKLVPEFMDRGKDELQFMLEMLVRAYDPCISCSTHAVNVIFK